MSADGGGGGGEGFAGRKPRVGSAPSKPPFLKTVDIFEKHEKMAGSASYLGGLLSLLVPVCTLLFLAFCAYHWDNRAIQTETVIRQMGADECFPVTINCKNTETCLIYFPPGKTRNENGGNKFITSQTSSVLPVNICQEGVFFFSGASFPVTQANVRVSHRPYDNPRNLVAGPTQDFCTTILEADLNDPLTDKPTGYFLGSTSPRDFELGGNAYVQVGNSWQDRPENNVHVFTVTKHISKVEDEVKYTFMKQGVKGGFTDSRRFTDDIVNNLCDKSQVFDNCAPTVPATTCKPIIFTNEPIRLVPSHQVIEVVASQRNGELWMLVFGEVGGAYVVMWGIAYLIIWIQNTWILPKLATSGKRILSAEERQKRGRTIGVRSIVPGV